MRFGPAVVVLAACSSARAPEPLVPIVGNLVVGAPWPVPIKDPLALVKVYATLDGKPVPVMVLIACGANIGGLSVERVFVPIGKTSFDRDAIAVADPVNGGLELATRWLQAFERQGFELQSQFGGSVEAIRAMSNALLEKKARGDDVGPKDIPQNEIDRDQLQRGNSYFMVVAKRGTVTRTLSIGNIMGTTKVNVTEDLACPTNPRMVDLDAPEIEVR